VGLGAWEKGSVDAVEAMDAVDALEAMDAGRVGTLWARGGVGGALEAGTLAVAVIRFGP
jgi:hypothetical protein